MDDELDDLIARVISMEGLEPWAGKQMDSNETAKRKKYNKLAVDILLEAEERRKNDPDTPYTEEEEEAIAEMDASYADPIMCIPSSELGVLFEGPEVNLDDL